jgi:Niemann-Pick C1 protein
VLLAAAGVLRLQVVTEPAKLWVGPGSQAAAERDAYEAAFGPFYRISQLILSTSLNESGRFPPIVSDANIRALFAMQAEVDALSAPGYSASGDGESGATLDSVCLKPLGDACATQSVLQYWQGDLDSYEGSTGPALSPSFCFDHWTVSCFAATGAPVDPRVVLGGFPRTGNVSFAEDATAFIVTYPLVSDPTRRRAAEAWEAVFLDLAAGKLTQMAGDAGLRLSYSTERSVEDELKRESGTDAGTVALSYGVMLLYVALALGKIPRGATWRTAAVHGKSLLALGGVAAVAAAVVAALGLCGWTGISATLLIMEVIPFLALAIGVDNVFIMTAAAERCSRPGMTPAERAAAALAASGPSMREFYHSLLHFQGLNAIILVFL